MNFEKIYAKLPITIQNILISSYGSILYFQRYGKFYKKKMQYLRNRDHKNFDFQKYQLDSLNKLLLHAYNNSEFYRKKMKNIKLPLKNVKDLAKIPITTKEELRTNINQIITVSEKKAIKGATGGTTGKSLNILYTCQDMQERMAILDYFKELHGVYKGMKRASFTGRNLIPVEQKSKVFWRYNRPLRQMLFSCFHVSNENIPAYIDALNKFKPHSLDGVPSAMCEIARYILRNDIRLKFKPIAIFPTAETLLVSDRKLLEKAFHCVVRNQYASSEGAPFITECPEGNLHLNIDTGVFEKLDSHKNVSEMLVTSFTTFGTPLIRYKIEDCLEFTNEKCTCGINTPITKAIIGRNSDFLYSRERGKVGPGHMANVVKTLPLSIKNVQYIQKKEDQIVVKLVTDEKLYEKKHLQIMKEEIRKRLGKNMEIVFVFVNEIEREKSGKFRFIKNYLEV